MNVWMNELVECLSYGKYMENFRQFQILEGFFLIEQTVKYCLIFGIPKSFPYICIKIEKKKFSIIDGNKSSIF